MRRTVNKLSVSSATAVWPPHLKPQTIPRWSHTNIPPRAGEPSKRPFHHSVHLASKNNSRQPDGGHYRDLHSTARSAAQPRRSDDEDDAYDHSPVDWDSVALDDFPTPARGRAVASNPELDGIDFSPPEYEEFDTQYAFDDSHLPEPPSFEDSFDPHTKKIKKRRRRRDPNRPVLPPLPEGELPPDGMSRFDWRETSLSSGFGLGRKKKGDLWYPHLAPIKRIEAVKGILEVGETFHDEVDRYEKHFKPLLQAEYDEEERIFMQRLKEWSTQRLVDEGFMLHELGASVMQKQPPKVDGKVWTFNYTGKGDNKPLPFNKIESGSFVFLSRTNPCYDPVLEDGTVQKEPENMGEDDKDPELEPSQWMKVKVYSQAKNFVRLIIPRPIEGLERGHWRIDLGTSDWSLQVQLQAMKALHNDSIQQDMQDIRDRPSPRRPSPSSSPRTNTPGAEIDEPEIDSILNDLDSARNKQIQTILNGTSTRDLLLRAFQTDYQTPESSANLALVPIVPEPATMKASDIDATPIPTPITHARSMSHGILARDQLIQSWAKRYRRPRALRIEGDPVINLNPSQLRAMAMMLSERISLVQGPPGTGKTRVIVEVIKLLKQHFKVPFPIMVCAHTNVAVDNLLAPLRKEGINAIRSGSTAKVREDLKQYTLEEMEQDHPLFSRVENLRVALEDVKKSITAGGEGTNWPELFEARKMLQGKIYGLQRMIDREVLQSGDVICTTLLSAASRRLQQIDFPMVFIDEASMATEPLTNIPLMKGSSHVAIIGDHKQLPPVIISPEAHAGGLATSLFERLIHEKHIPSVMLDTQYRMHSDISSFPNRAFYSGALQDGPPLDGTNFDPPRTSFLVPGSNVTFIDHDHPESPQSSSLANFKDATIVSDVVADLMYHNPELKGSQIGIIAPYTAQVRLILEKLLDDTDRQEAFIDIIGGERTRELENIEVKTVDGFQGREKEIMIVSMVRSNPGGWVGFVGDWRRLNVALTRARRALLIIGSARTLAKARYGRAASEHLPQGGDKVLRDHIRHLKKEGLIMPAD